MNERKGKLVILSGPSGVGKSPLEKAFRKFFPDLDKILHRLVLFNDRAPRPGEIDGVDYHFRTRKQIENLRNESSFIVINVRGDLQAVDVNALKSALEKSNVFYEGNPFIACELIQHPYLKEIEKLTIFLSPLTGEEILLFKSEGSSISLKDIITEVMRKKLLRRTLKQKGILGLKDLENIERRAMSAFEELKLACKFQYVIPNHDGEDSENWDAFYYPVGDARRTLLAFVELIKGNKPPDFVEHWGQDLLEGCN